MVSRSSPDLHAQMGKRLHIRGVALKQDQLPINDAALFTIPLPRAVVSCVFAAFLPTVQVIVGEVILIAQGRRRSLA